MESGVHIAFESIARQFLARYPSLPHEWRQVPSQTWGSRTDLVCAPGTDHEVWATLRHGAIAVGLGSDHVDFERFGRKLSDDELAAQAFDHFRSLLVRSQLIPRSTEGNET